MTFMAVLTIDIPEHISAASGSALAAVEVVGHDMDMLKLHTTAIAQVIQCFELPELLHLEADPLMQVCTLYNVSLSKASSPSVLCINDLMKLN